MYAYNCTGIHRDFPFESNWLPDLEYLSLWTERKDSLILKKTHINLSVNILQRGGRNIEILKVHFEDIPRRS